MEKLMTVEHAGSLYAEFSREELIEKIGEAPVIAAEKAEELKKVNSQAYDYITQIYPVWKQVNIERTGETEERDKMDVFISKVRAWANLESPVYTDLLAITA